MSKTFTYEALRNHDQRFAAWRSGGFSAQNFNRSTTLHIYNKLYYRNLTKTLGKTAVSSMWLFLR